MPAISDPTNLRRITLFRGMTLSQLAVLNGLMRRQVLPAGARIVMTDQLTDTAYVIQNGIVRIVRAQSDGTELLLEFLGPGDVIAALTVGEAPDCAHSILPLDETHLLWIDRHAFERCIQTMPELSANLSGVMARRLQLANDRIEALAGLDVRARIVRHLLLLARQYGEFLDDPTPDCVRIPLRLTQGDWARMVGASRVSVNHTMADLRRRNVLETQGNHHLLIRDMAALQKLR
jgi:CRP-like cAMP-binding protein